MSIISVGDYVRIKYISDILPIRKGKCLDIGCGPGIYKELVQNKGYEWVGIDAIKHEDAMLGNAENLPFKDEEFHAALLIEVLEHVYEFAAVLNEAKRVLCKHGILIVHTPNKIQKHILIKPKDNPEHVRMGFETDELQTVLESNGFSIDHALKTFNKFEALAWDLSYCIGNNLPFDISRIVDIEKTDFEPYGLLFRCRKR